MKSSPQLLPVETSRALSLFNVSGCRFFLTGLEIDPSVSFSQWVRIGRRLLVAHHALQWWIGDYLRFGQHRWGEKYVEAVRAFGIDEQTLRNWNSVAGSIQLSRRRDKLSYSHHAEIAYLSPDDQERLLDKAAEQKWSVRDLRREVRALRRLRTRSSSATFSALEIDFARAEEGLIELSVPVKTFGENFPIWRADCLGFLDQVAYDILHKDEAATEFVEDLIDKGTWDLAQLQRATKYSAETVRELCELLVESGRFELIEQGGETESARGARRQIIKPKSIPSGDSYSRRSSS